MPFRGQPLWRWAYEHAVESGLKVIVVTGDVELGVDCEEHNPRWADGIATSLQVAIRAAAHADAIVVGLADQPLVPAEAWRLVGASEAPIAVATYAGRRRNPVRLGRSVWPLLPTTGDQGASVLFKEHAVAEVACPGDPADVDRVEDLEQWS